MADRIDALRRQILAKEYGSLLPSGGDLPVAVVFPNTYSVGMSNLAFHWLLGEVSGAQRFYPERVFLPDGETAELYDKQRTPLRTLESGRSAAATVAWLVTLSFENDYPNLLRLLEMAGLPLRAEDRDERAPLIIVGGTGPMLNPEPIAPFVDAVLLGEGAAALSPFIGRLEAQVDSLDKEGFLRGLSDLPYAYVPQYFKPKFDGAGKRIALETSGGFSQPLTILRETSIDGSPTYTHIMTPDTEFADTFLIETFRGCHARCRFCAAGHLSLPPRDRKPSPDVFPEGASRAIGLVGAGVSSHEQIEEWIDLASARARVGISSLKLRTLSDSALRTLAEKGAKTVALAPEAGSTRLRRACNKAFTDEDILEEARRVIAGGFMGLKLYFMVGLPTETDEDVRAIAALTCAIRDAVMPIWKERGRAGTLTASVNPFIPKAQTPFQWAPFITQKDYNAARKTVTDLLRREGNVQVRFESYRQAQIQALLSMGDRDAAAQVERLAAGQKPDLKTPAAKALHQARDPESLLPWHFVDAGFSKTYLRGEYERALMGKISAPCVVGRCKHCGICAD